MASQCTPFVSPHLLQLRRPSEDVTEPTTDAHAKKHFASSALWTPTQSGSSRLRVQICPRNPSTAHSKMRFPGISIPWIEAEADVEHFSDSGLTALGLFL